MKKKKLILLIIPIALIIAIMCYLNNYYHSMDVDDYLKNNGTILVDKTKEGYYFDGPGEQIMIFYPGAKVEETAYIPLMYKLAEQGLDCFLVKMPYKLAILDINAADKIIKKYSYNSWNIGGHSLGGAMASIYSYKTNNKIDKIFLLGSYTTNNLNKKNIKTYFIYGSNDKIINKDKLEESKKLIENNYEEFIIEGGNHAHFGYYGEQKGDGVSSITREEQIDFTVSKIIEILNKSEIN